MKYLEKIFGTMATSGQLTTGQFWAVEGVMGKINGEKISPTFISLLVGKGYNAISDVRNGW